jgi:antitoxin PrlF
MNEIVKAESTLTDRYQTTIPDIVRQTLGLEKRDKIQYIIQNDGTVAITRGSAINQDPLVEKFLQFLAQDIQQNPQSIQTITNSKIEHIRSLVGNLEVDLDAPLIDEEEE